MKRYELFDVDDFITDEYFIDWVLNPQPAHHAFWEDWKQKHPDQLSKLNSAIRVINALAVRPLQAELTTEETDELISQVSARIAPDTVQKNSFLISKKLWMAAAIVLITMGGIWFYHKSNDVSNHQAFTANIFKEFNNTSTKSKIVRFADGSLAVLKPKSKIKYPRRFTGSTRTVHLEGEAFFEIQKNHNQPFLVISQDMVTQVVGTSFTVKAFGNETEFKVIVNTGKVKVYRKTEAQKQLEKSIMLIPHQQAVYSKAIKVIKRDTVQTKLLLATEIANQSFTLNKVKLNEVIAKLEEAYHVQINYDKAQLGELTLTAQLADLPLDQKVELVCKAINANCNFSNGEIYISSHHNQINK